MKLIKPIIAALCLALGLNACANNKESKNQKKKGANMEKTLMVLDKINTPEDLRGLSAEEMNLLSAEIRDLILKKVNTTGGHLGPNLGMVEATIALHRVFNSPVD